MDFLGDLLALGGAAVTGGLTGVIGFGIKGLLAWLGAREERTRLKMQQDHELALLDRQLQARAAETEHEREIAAEETRQASYSFANVAQPVWKWAASIISLMRPAITLYLLIATTALAWAVMFGKPLPYVDSPAIVKEIVTTVVYLTATAVTWWFGDRPPQRR